MKILAALPVYNEESHVVSVLAEVSQYANNILVVNDGSSDGTADVLSTVDGIHVVTHEENMGYGAALRTAFQYAQDEDYDVLVTIDCDGQHQPCLIPQLAAAVFPDNGPPIDIVSGSRYLKQFEGASIPPEERRQINVQITAQINKELGLSLTDGFCGFKAYRVPSLHHFKIDEVGYAMPLQFWVQAVAAGLTIEEFPVPLVYLEEERSFGGSLDDSRKRLAYYQEVLARELSHSSIK